MISIRSAAQSTAGATLDQPLDHLSACHRRIEQRLDTLERVVPVLWERREEALQALHNAFAFLDGNGVLHTEDEEASLFPRLQPKLQAGQAAFVASLEADHQAAHKLYAALRDVVAKIEAAPLFDASLAAEYETLVSRFCALYRRHIQAEDSQLIDISRALLTDEELAQISSEMKARRAL
ncbi:MAG: hemerythrin domain-containing protein [Acidobacteriota bacterium]